MKGLTEIEFKLFSTLRKTRLFFSKLTKYKH